MIKKFSTLFLTATIVLSMLPAAMAGSSTNGQALVYPISESYEMKLKGFNDIANHPAKAEIEYLLGREIILGYNNEAFRPTANMTNAEAITLLTKAFNLNIDAQTTTKTENIFTNIEQSKWYSDAYLAAHLNEVELSKDVKVSDIVTREQFASWIIDQLDRIGVYPVIRMYIHIADGEQISTDYSGKVQTLLLTGLAELAEDQNFRPKDAITRGEAAQWMSKAVKFADELIARQEGQLTADLPFEYNAEKALTHAEAITLLTKALQLNEADNNAITEEMLEKSYPNLKTDEWYSDYYLKAIKNEVAIANDVKATDTVTREQFASWIVNQFDRIGPYPVILMYLHIGDEDKITPELSSKIQILLLTKIAELDEDGKFRPQDAITGAEAVAWLEKASDFAKQLKKNIAEANKEVNLPYTVSEKALDEKVKEIAINVELPHPGYNAEVSSVEYEGNLAIINVSIIEPEPGKMYPQVITPKTLIAEIEAGYETKINMKK